MISLMLDMQNLSVVEKINVVHFFYYKAMDQFLQISFLGVSHTVNILILILIRPTRTAGRQINEPHHE